MCVLVLRDSIVGRKVREILQYSLQTGARNKRGLEILINRSYREIINTRQD